MSEYEEDYINFSPDICEEDGLPSKEFLLAELTDCLLIIEEYEEAADVQRVIDCSMYFNGFYFAGRGVLN